MKNFKRTLYFEKIAVLFFFIFIGVQSPALYAQTTAIPDSHFESALIEQGIDSDGIINGQVLTSDIENVTSLSVESERFIHSLTGIEGFAALESLDISGTSLTSLDVSNNIQLKQLYCSNYPGAIIEIVSLDLSNNINLELLYSDGLYLLENLNLKNGNNTILNVALDCILDFGIPCDLSLTCVTVDDAASATNDEPPYDGWFIKANYVYSEDCTLEIADQKTPVFSLYPNPVKDILYIKNKAVAINTIKVYDAMGKLLLTSEGNRDEINTSLLPRGMFFVKLETNKGIVTRKVIKY